MENKEFSQLLEKRTKDFAIDIIKMSARLPNTAESKVIKYQITKSGTSIGANYREANRARSKADFVSKIRICESEASETVYWLELITTIGYINDNTTDKIQTEAKEILALFTTISRKLKPV
ncbi:MAG: four helix bundle protein [Bacteroidales bacterium]|nr:four helix bundle protein [Bacteroidales bacterium]